MTGVQTCALPILRGQLRATAGDTDRSQELTAYPADPTVAPPQDLRASVDWTAASTIAPVKSKPRIVSAPAPVPATSPVPPQPAAPDRGNDAERATCRPNVVKFCQAELSKNQDDVFAILAGRQSSRTKISTGCQRVPASHGQ